MTERPKFFDDLAGVAGGAMSALAGLREEAESTMKARAEEMIRKFDLVRREDLEAVQEMAANARAAQATMELRLTAMEAKLAALHAASAPTTPASTTPAPTPTPTPPPILPATPVPPRLGDDVAEGSPS